MRLWLLFAALRHPALVESLTRLPLHPCKRGIVPVVLEQRPARIRPIEHMIDHIRRRGTQRSPLRDPQLAPINSNNGS